MVTRFKHNSINKAVRVSSWVVMQDWSKCWDETGMWDVFMADKFYIDGAKR